MIGVGGAVLGGAGKTPVAIEIARALAKGAGGDGVALIGHAYRARPGFARVVAESDRADEVGDDALSAARSLSGDVRVVVAATRQDAVDHAASIGARVLVVDGLLQAAPRRLFASILLLDGAAPWGSGACPPAGDMRAPRAALLAAADLIAAVCMEGAPIAPDLPASAIRLHAHVAGAISASGERTSLDAIARTRAGLLLTVARPARIEAALARASVRPIVSIALGDHTTPSPRVLARAARAPVDVWLTTARCAVKLPAAIGGAPVLALDHRINVAPLAARLR